MKKLTTLAAFFSLLILSGGAAVQADTSNSDTGSGSDAQARAQTRFQSNAQSRIQSNAQSRIQSNAQSRAQLIAQSRTHSNAQSNAQSNIVYQDWHDGRRGRDIPVKIYLPKTGNAPFPVVIFSHGLGGSREAAAYLGDYWSQHGYLGVFVQHAGSDSAVWQEGGVLSGGREAILAKMKGAANGKNAVDRADDIQFVLNELDKRNREDPEFKGQLQLNHIALAGHSFGAGTTLAIAGQNYARINKKDDRIKAAIYLCPPVSAAGKSDPQRTYSNIQIPGMLLTGTLDDSPINDTKAADRRIPFDGIKAPHQYLINFDGADHSVFGGRAFRMPKEKDEQFHAMIEVVTTKFLDSVLKNDASASTWLDGTGAKSFLGNAAIYERK